MLKTRQSERKKGIKVAKLNRNYYQNGEINETHTQRCNIERKLLPK